MRREPLELKAWYTIPELARAANVTPRQMRTELRACGVPLTRAMPCASGRACRVRLRDLRARAADIWQSIVAVEAARSGR